MADTRPDLRTLRGDRTLDEMASQLGITKAGLSLIERGLRNPGLEVALAIEKVYGVPPQAWVDSKESA